MFRKTIFAAGAVLLIVAALGAYLSMPSPTYGQNTAMRLPVDKVRLVAVTAGGERDFSIEIADDPSERSRGLMFRESMADDHGMLFVFEQTQPVGFWMKNTPMPLDLLFIGQDGRVRDILPGRPFSEAAISPREPVRFVLEFKEGTAAKAGIVPGDFIRHPAVNSAPGAAHPG